MLQLLKTFLSFFSPYAKPFEKKVNRFFKYLNDRSSKKKVHKKLLKLMQEDLVAVNLWMEKRYKGYIYLKKRVRKKLYQNMELLVEDFREFDGHHKIDLSLLKKIFERKKLPLPADREKLIYLAKIADYLKPGRHYRYQEGANFGKLLKDPKHQTLIGDCNQMVTLYAYLYSLRFPLEDLSIKILPGHVCLHFERVDLEATNGQFRHYEEFDYIAPIQEIIAVNLLDVSDADEKTTRITPRTLLQSAHFAYLTSSMKDLVTHNLNAAYQHLGIDLVKKHQFEGALVYLKKLQDRKLIEYAYHQAVIHFIKKQSFSEASRYAGRSGKRDLNQLVLSHQAVYFYKQGQFEKALTIYRKLGDQKGVRACYLAQYNQLAKSLEGIRKLSEARAKKSVYQKMKALAQKADYQKGVRQMEDILGRM